MALELHVNNSVFHSENLGDLKRLASNMGGDYSIYQVFKSKMWQIPEEKYPGRLQFNKMNFKQMREAYSAWEEGEAIKVIADRYSVSKYFIGKVIKQMQALRK